MNVDISGASDQLEATQQALKANYLVALILVYLVMVAIFTHWGFPLLIMTTIPLGIAAGIVGLALLNGFGSLLGAVGLGPVERDVQRADVALAVVGVLALRVRVVDEESQSPPR